MSIDERKQGVKLGYLTAYMFVITMGMF